MSSHTAQATMPAPQNGTVPPRQVPHAARRPREYLTPKEVERLIAAARQDRYGHRDATMILVAYRHGLRVAELCALRWDQVDFEARPVACPADQERHAQRPPTRRRGAAGLAQAPVCGGAVPVCVHHR